MRVIKVTRRRAAVTEPETGPVTKIQVIEYLSRLPKPGEIPAGRVIVHNSVRPTRKLGRRGFRAWLQFPGDTIEPCPCRWAPELGRHYRVRRR
jgi:hypothetical protein